MEELQLEIWAYLAPVLRQATGSCAIIVTEPQKKCSERGATIALANSDFGRICRSGRLASQKLCLCGSLQ